MPRLVNKVSARADLWRGATHRRSSAAVLRICRVVLLSSFREASSARRARILGRLVDVDLASDHVLQSSQLARSLSSASKFCLPT